MSHKPIASYGLVGNSLTAALIGTDGSLDWCCLPRFDSPSLFAALLDDEKGGRFALAPATEYRSQHAYLPNTNMLRTEFTSTQGRVSVVDFMPCYRDQAPALHTPHRLYRQLRGESGQVLIEAEFAPRFDYARDPSQVEPVPGGVVARGGGQQVYLLSTHPITAMGNHARAQFTLSPGQEAVLVMAWDDETPQAPTLAQAQQEMELTRRYWEGVADECGCSYHGGWSEQVVRSFLVLHLLMYSPSGAIVAAPTTSLPEEIGGERNWDYRYCWLRDSAFTLDALFSVGHTREAKEFMRWLRQACQVCGADLQIMMGIGHEKELPEEVLPHLNGYRGSRPVRIGNAAAAQSQLDIYGELLGSIHTFSTFAGELDPEVWELASDLVEATIEQWREPDHGIWEVRAGPFHFVHSKLMCWVALDRGISLAEKVGETAVLHRWRAVREEIRQDILTQGWHPGRRAFVQHYQSTAMDASNLLMPLVGFLPATDPHIVATVERTMEELDANGLLRRYRTQDTEDGLTGSEGTFTLCTFWLVQNLARMGRLEKAQALFDNTMKHANGLGLFSEMVNPQTGEMLGNFPQALTHIGLILAAQDLWRASTASVPE